MLLVESIMNKILFSFLVFIMLAGFKSFSQNTSNNKPEFSDKAPTVVDPETVSLFDDSKLLVFIVDAKGKICRKDSTKNTYITFDQLSHQLLNEQKIGRKGLMVFNIGKDYSFLKSFLKKLDDQGVKLYNMMSYEDMLIELKKRKVKNISTK